LSTDAAKTELQDGGGEEVHTLTHISVTSDEEEEEESHSEGKSAFVASEHIV